MMEKRYSHDVEIQFKDISGDNKAYLKSILKSFTELEKSLLRLLFKSEDALTKNQIRNIFTYSYLKKLLEKYINDSSLPIQSPHKYEMEFKLMCAKTKLDEIKEMLHIDFPTRLIINRQQLSAVINTLFPVRTISKQPEKNEEYEQAFLNTDEYNKLLDNETNSQFLIRVRNIFTNSGFSVPSISSIEPALKYFKQRGWADFRIQNKNEVWFLTPQMNMMMFKVDELQ